MEEKKWMSVAQMGDLLGLKKTERYWLVHKHYFETKQIRGKLMVDISSFEKWYANQVRYHKVCGTEPGLELRKHSYSARDISILLDIHEQTAYELINRSGLSMKKSFICIVVVLCMTIIVTNRDGKFDDNDTLQSPELKARGLELYCFISNVSFSCGNIVPCIFKDSKKVTLIGQTSGGGACSMAGMSSATGTLFNISSPYIFSFQKNGSFYDMDRGAEPEFWIKDLSKLYDRAYMNMFLDKID